MATKSKFNRREFLRMAAGVTSGALLASCTVAVPSAPGGEEEQGPSTTTDAPAGSEVTIRIARATGPVMVPDAMLQDRFEAYGEVSPQVNFEYEAVPFNDYFQKLGLGLSSDNAADIFMVNEVWAYAEAGYLAPAPEEYAEDVRNNFGAAAEPPDYNGNIYGYPFEGGLRLVFYNKDHFEEAGIPEPTGNVGAKDWDQLLEWANQLTKVENGQIVREGWKINQPGYWIAVAEWFWMLDGEFCTDDCGVWSLNQPAWNDAVQWWADMAQQHNVASMNFAADTFGKGQTAMTVDGLFAVGQLREFSQVDFGVFMNPPQTEGGPVYHDDGPWMYGVNNGSAPEVQAEAWNFLQWLTNEENGVEFTRNYISTYRQSALEMAKAEIDDPVLAVFLDATANYVHPRTPKYWRIWVTRVRDPLAKVYLGELGVEEMAEMVEQQINDDIQSGAGAL